LRTSGRPTNASENGDGALGLNVRICRRDFLNAALLASGNLLLTSLTPMELLGQQPWWGGYSGVGDYAGANGNTQDVVLGGHAVRDGAFRIPASPAVDTGEVFDLVIVGGGDQRPRWCFVL
jgi:spermidine dehydrogenase